MDMIFLIGTFSLFTISTCQGVSEGMAPYYHDELGIDGSCLIGIKKDSDFEGVIAKLINEIGPFELQVIRRLMGSPNLVHVSTEMANIDKIRKIEGVAYVEDDFQVGACSEDTKEDKDKKGDKELKDKKGDEVVQDKKGDKKVDPNEFWNLDRINQRHIPLDGNRDLPHGGKGVNVYVVDSGIFNNHEDFEDRAIQSYDVNKGGDGRDCHGHGLHVAGIVAGKTYGIAKNATIRGVKALNCRGFGQKIQLVRAMNWVSRKRRLPCVVLLGFSVNKASAVIDEAVQGMIDKECVVVVPAGNEGIDSCNVSPARVTEAITVGASTIQDYVSSKSNTGKCIDLFAPGNNIVSAWSISLYDKDKTSGTSQAAAHVAGVAALKLSEGVPSDKVKAKIIKDSSKMKLRGVLNGAPNRLLYVKPPKVRVTKPKSHQEL